MWTFSIVRWWHNLHSPFDLFVAKTSLLWILEAVVGPELVSVLLIDNFLDILASAVAILAELPEASPLDVSFHLVFETHATVTFGVSPFEFVGSGVGS